jgi:urease accessory protein
MRFPVLFALVLTLGLTQTALAHPGHAGHEFSDGLLHPLTGIDHLLAIVAVGLLALRTGGNALWAMPCAFLTSMFAGASLAVLNVSLPAVEGVVAISVLSLGILLAIPKAVPWKIAAGLVILFAAFHGYAHATEMASGGAFSMYATGFLLASALLHTTGVLGGLVIAKSLNQQALRVTGGAIGLAGGALLISLI